MVAPATIGKDSLFLTLFSHMTFVQTLETQAPQLLHSSMLCDIMAFVRPMILATKNASQSILRDCVTP